MGLWPARARSTVDAVRVAPDVRAAEAFPSLSNVYPLTTGISVPVSGVYDSPVSRDLAMTVPGIQRGVTLKATTVAALPLERVDASGRRVDLGWLDQPEPGRSRFATFLDVLYDLEFDGRAYLWVHDRDSTGAPRLGGCEYVALSRVGDPNGLLPPGTTRQTYPITIDGKPVKGSDVIGFEGWHNGIRYHGARLIRTALALEAAARRFADTPMPSVTLVNTSGYDLDDDEITALITAYKAGRNQEGVAYVNAGVDPKVTGFNSAELQLVEARQYVGTQIANLVGLPADAIAGASAASGGSLTYANVTQRSRDLVDYGLKAPMSCIESRLSLSDVNGAAWATQVTPRGSTVRFSLDALLRGDPLQRAQLYAQLIPLGVLTVAEARAMEDLTPEGPTP